METARNAINSILGNTETPEENGANSGANTSTSEANVSHSGDNVSRSGANDPGSAERQTAHQGTTEPSGQHNTTGTTGQSTHTGTAGQSTQTGHTSHTGDAKQTGDAGNTKQTGLHLHNPLHHHKSNESDDTDDSLARRNQSPDQGPDPALVGDANPKSGKLTGAGVDGSHSAVFGLTPDGHKHDDTKHGSAPPKPAHSKQTEVSKNKGDRNDDTSRAPAGAGVKDQMDTPEAGGKGLERTDPVPQGAGSGGKPGAGFSGPAQGSGDVPSH